LNDDRVGENADALVLLHAFKCANAAQSYRTRHPARSLVVALTGTDLYRDLRSRPSAMTTLELADRIVLLQSAGLAGLPPAIRRKCDVIHQSSVPANVSKYSRDRGFRVCVVGHLRAVKDPMRCAMAIRSLPEASGIRLDHIGGAMTEAYRKAAVREERVNSRYHWIGERTHAQTRRHIARSHLLVLTSKMEGGANVINEACVAGTPILTSRIDGSIGLLGRNHPGMFETGNTEMLRDLLIRCENDPRFYQRLCAASNRKANLFSPDRERASWRTLLNRLG
jgi:putative glycosyltransferase (TIGR04348 family)